ncbi:MAG TPA: rhomboid family intramembrane serine protease [Xanthobacteraceae bacterium]|nr:rhomboid family intramembrane serine protease [Xanthobacteraceae bacterium]
MQAPSQPIFNVPAIVVLTLAVLCIVHGVRELVLSAEADNLFLLYTAFIPARYETGALPYPGGLGADAWTFVSYAFIHGGLMHLGLNALWFLIFASPVARRFGTPRFAAFFVATAVAGALAHLATHRGDPSLMVGASAAISGFMAAAMRFAFQRGGPLGLLGRQDDLAYRVKAASLVASFRDPRIVAFLAVWFGLNLLFGSGVVSVGDDEQPIAWQAHIGGFLAGLLGFSLFDPVRDAAGDGNHGVGADLVPPQG